MQRTDVLRRPSGSGRVAHVAALDGVRGLAVLAVVVYHLDPDVLPGGFLGVSLFFTLSGFLITNLLVAEWRATGTIDVGTFWSRRFRRLLPASLAGIALVIILSPAWTASQLADLPGDVVGALGYVANWRFIAAGDRYGAGFEAPSPLLHYWSLAIEEQFYLVVGALTAVLAAGRSLRRWVVVFIGLALVSVVATLVLYDPLDSDRVYFGSLTRSAELLAGVLLALAIRTEVPSRLVPAARIGGVVGLGAAVTGFVVVDLTTDGLYRGGLWLMAVASVLMICGALVEGPLRRLLSWRVLTTLGLVSYGIYVFHWPLFLWLDSARTGLDGWALVALRLGATAVVTVASFVWLERPVREARFGGRPLLAVGLAATMLVAGGAWLVAQDADDRAIAGEAPAIVLSSAAAPLAAEVGPSAATVDGAVPDDEPASGEDPSPDEGAVPDEDTAPDEDAAPDERAAAAPVTPPRLTNVVIMGDSLVHQAYPTIEDRLARLGIESTLVGGPGETLMTGQAAWLDELDQAIAEQDPDVVILQSCCGTGDPRRPDPYLNAQGVELVPDSPEIWAEWERLAGEYTATARRGGALVLWILAPPAQTNGYYGPIESRIGIANDIYAGIAACRDMVFTLDWGLLAGPDGGYVDALPDEDGDLITVRSEDGLHFTEAGQALLADLTRSVAQRIWTGRSVGDVDQCEAVAPLAASPEQD